jgi:hypothetical protein
MQHRQKVAIARQLRAETTMPWEWIARNLIMGSPVFRMELLTAHEPTLVGRVTPCAPS